MAAYGLRPLKCAPGVLRGGSPPTSPLATPPPRNISGPLPLTLMSCGGGRAPGTAPKPTVVPCHKSGSIYGVQGALWCPLTWTARGTAARCTRWAHPSPAVASQAQSRVCGDGASGGGGGGGGSNVELYRATAATRRPP
ncbi:hypothetical protein VaNZ11_003251 [Volvox africanus]|uniref:Uncharacterized protein n=1 Tax=Volvox africanus TaxID=51714 RepID=A0ABQ5RUV8_9CHLO|nr:hypothetical protein VaNZ11_003251 [Volvox africanus]